MSIQTEVKGGKLVITVDISDAAIKAAPMSKSGKNKLVATTSSFVPAGDKVKFQLNVIAKE